jgi:DNA-directed RNA polymerase subunit RPC12/RpoP
VHQLDLALPVARFSGSGETAVSERPIKQNVPTTLACPQCGGTLLVMTRKIDRRRFLACRNRYHSDIKCPYTSNELPGDLLQRESGAPMLPGFGS